MPPPALLLARLSLWAARLLSCLSPFSQAWRCLPGTGRLPAYLFWDAAAGTLLAAGCCLPFGCRAGNADMRLTKTADGVRLFHTFL